MFRNDTEEKFEDPQNDSIWILSSTFIIFTMQSGEQLLIFHQVYKL